MIGFHLLIKSVQRNLNTFNSKVMTKVMIKPEKFTAFGEIFSFGSNLEHFYREPLMP